MITTEDESLLNEDLLATDPLERDDKFPVSRTVVACEQDINPLERLTEAKIFSANAADNLLNVFMYSPGGDREAIKAALIAHLEAIERLDSAIDNLNANISPASEHYKIQWDMCGTNVCYLDLKNKTFAIQNTQAFTDEFDSVRTEIEPIAQGEIVPIDN